MLERCQSGELGPEVGVRLAGALRYYWEATGKLAEGTAWLNAMLSISTGLPAAVRAKALCGLGVLAYWRGDYQQGAIFCQQALDAGQEHGDMVIVGEAQHFLAHVAQHQGDPDQGEALLTASHGNFLAIDHRWGVRRARNCLADALRLQQKYDLAARNLEEAIREQRESTGERDIMLAMYLSNYGNVLNRQGKYQQARHCFREGIRISHALNNRLLLAYLVDGLAGNAVLSGRAEEAAGLMGASTAIFEAEKVTSMAAIDQVDHDYYVAEVEARLEPHRLRALQEMGKQMTAKETVDYVLEQQELAD
ncbi:MAG: tetratricopeptide repeat protein [Anaerolineae bacterium]|nr:tetratricopeptide repeat protein [Anaerolineae bacterium]